MRITKEMIRKLKREDMEYDWEDDPRFRDTHYSEKTGHRKRGKTKKQRREREKAGVS